MKKHMLECNTKYRNFSEVLRFNACYWQKMSVAIKFFVKNLKARVEEQESLKKIVFNFEGDS